VEAFMADSGTLKAEGISLAVGPPIVAHWRCPTTLTYGDHELLQRLRDGGLLEALALELLCGAIGLGIGG
jgi:hypothetical protein